MNRTHVDWLQYRCQSTDVRGVVDALRGGFGPAAPQLTVRPRKSGWMGYAGSADINLGDMVVGKCAYGGESQKGWVMAAITGKGCQWIADWDAAQDDLGKLPDFQLRRVDIALDTFKREVTHESVLAAYSRGAFSRGGRPPKMRKIEGADPEDGRTVYIGARDQGQFLRGYEKGWELARAFPKGELLHVDGVPLADLYRLELELKVKHSPLPADLIDKRDQYFAGGYPYLHEVLSVEPEIFVQRRDRGPRLDMAGALAGIRRQYGATLFTALAAHHGDLTAVWDKIVGKKHNRELLEAGVLLVDHD